MSVKLSRYVFRRIRGRLVPIRIGAEAKTNASNFAMAAVRKLQGKRNLEAAQKVAEFTKQSVVKEKVFHGTSNSFRKFSYGKIGSAAGTAGAGRGFYFANTKQNAKAYGSKVKEAYLNIQKPLKASFNGEFDSGKIKKKSLVSMLRKADLSSFGEGTTVEKAAAMLKKYNTNDVDLINDAGVSAFGNNFKELYKRLKKYTGIDGIVQSNKKVSHFIAFSPEQIMSAPKRSKIYSNALKRSRRLKVRGK
jgi:hypothetical protein